MQAAQDARVRSRATLSCSGEIAVGACETALLKVARRQHVQPVEREQVRGGAQLAILGRRRAERFVRQSSGQLDELRGCAQSHALRTADGNRLDILRTQHGAAAAAAGVPAVVRNRGVAHQPLAGRADRGDLKIGAESLAQPILRLAIRQAPQFAGRFQRTSSSSITRIDGCGALPASTIASCPVFFPASANPLLASESLIRSVSGLLLTTANLAEVVSGLPTSGLKTNASAACSRKRIGFGRALAQQDIHAQTAAAEEASQPAFVQVNSCRRAGRQIDAQVAAVISGDTMTHVSILSSV